MTKFFIIIMQHPDNFLNHIYCHKAHKVQVEYVIDQAQMLSIGPSCNYYECINFVVQEQRVSSQYWTVSMIRDTTYKI